jgi:hypothetical protein
MSSRTGNWIITLGALVLFLGLTVLGTSLANSGDPDLLPAGAGLFSSGALAVAGGVYLKARALQQAISSEAPRKESTNVGRTRGGCELCGIEAPVVQCKIHRLQVCGTCLSQHYDARSCIYIPSTRGAAGKPGKGLAAKARGA